MAAMAERAGFEDARSDRAGAASAAAAEPIGGAASGSAGAAEPDCDALARLTRLRKSIDNIDAALVHLLAERFRSTQEVGVLKAEHGLPAEDPDREAWQIARLTQLAEDADLDPKFAEKWFNFVVAEVIRHHKQAAQEL